MNAFPRTVSSATPLAAALLAASLLMAPAASVYAGPASATHAHAAPVSTEHVQIVEKEGYRFITSDGLPDHTPGDFPRRGNPNTISAQKHAFRVPLNPKPASGEAPSSAKLFGVAVNGVPFEPGTAEIWSPQGRTRGGPNPNAWRYEALTGGINLGLDDHQAHVQPSGMYHYHALPIGLYERLAGAPADQAPQHMVLLGWAADGFPLYGPWAHVDAADATSPLVKVASSHRVKRGDRPTGETSPGGAYDGTYTQDWEYVEGHGDLDEHNGRFGVTPEHPKGTYYYVLTEDHPYIPRSHKGTPDPSFAPKRGRGEHGRRGGREGRRERGDRGPRGDRPPRH